MSCVGAGAQAQQVPQAESPPGGVASAERTEGEVIGASLSHPSSWSVERERFTFGRSYGYTLWRPSADKVHGGSPAVRVALAYGLEPGGIGEKVEEISAAYPDLPVERQSVKVARHYRGVAVGPIPGSTPSTEVYAAVEGRVYRINVYGEELGRAGRDLLRSLRFEPPARPVRSLGLPAANAPEALFADVDSRTAERDGTPEATFGAASFSRSATGEMRVGEGCWRADPRFWAQIQHDERANRNPNDGIPTGFARVGSPNFWDHYSHGRLGYGRCAEREWTNDKFAVDYRLNTGDLVFSPFRKGTVTFAGRNVSHRDYGIFVVIRTAGGRYVNLSAHLSALAKGIVPGKVVYSNTVIGLAGATGGGRVPVGPAHLHQAFYRYPSYTPAGAPYGGAGLQVVRHHYAGVPGKRPGGVYTFGWQRSRSAISGGSLASN